MGITIIGLGPGHIDQLTLQAWRILEGAQEVFLRTSRHPLIDDLPPTPTYHNFDELYETASDFESLYQTIADKIIELGKRPQGVIYAVPGHPMVGENTPLLIINAAKEANITVTLIDGLSFIEPSLSALEIDGIEGLQIHDAIEIAQAYHPPLNPNQPSLIAQVYSQIVASDLKITLMNQYPDKYPVILLHRAGTSDSIIERMALYEIDRSPHIAHMTSLYIPAIEAPSSFAALQNVMAHLRSTEGCPWDRKQTHRSLRPYLLEEAYEILEAIDADNPEELSEELGDAYMAIGGSFGTGSFPPDLPPGERRFEAVSEDVMDGALAAVGVPFFLVDLRGAEDDPAVIEWLGQEREWLAQDSTALLVPHAAFDLVYFVKNISRSQPTPAALRRYRSLGSAGAEPD